MGWMITAALSTSFALCMIILYQVLQQIHAFFGLWISLILNETMWKTKQKLTRPATEKALWHGFGKPISNRGVCSGRLGCSQTSVSDLGKR